LKETVLDSFWKQ